MKDFLLKHKISLILVVIIIIFSGLIIFLLSNTKGASISLRSDYENYQLVFTDKEKLVKILKDKRLLQTQIHSSVMNKDYYFNQVSINLTKNEQPNLSLRWKSGESDIPGLSSSYTANGNALSFLVYVSPIDEGLGSKTARNRLFEYQLLKTICLASAELADSANTTVNDCTDNLWAKEVKKYTGYNKDLPIITINKI